jgi:trk system potassium uptake protein TrkA
MNCCIIGIGQFGYAAAIQLIENGNQVCAVDKDITIISNIQDKVSYAVCLDIKDEKSLSMIGIDTFDAIILAMGQNFEQLVIIAGLIKKNFNVPLIICRANNDQQKTILDMIGVEYIILPEKESALQLVDRISVGFGYFYRIAENYSLTYVHCKKSWIGLTIEEIREKYPKVLLLGKKNQSNIEEINDYDVLHGNEIIMFSGENQNLLSITGN